MCHPSHSLLPAFAVVFFQQLAIAAPAAVPDTLAQRTVACTICHGKEGRSTNEGYFPRIAGKPAGYLYNQLVNFREGRRHNAAMTQLIDNLSDAYLMEIAQYFSALDLPYPSPVPQTNSAAQLAHGEALVLHGDAARRVPACVQCHGTAMTGTAPSIPGLLGLPRDYLVGQFGGWKTGERHALAPDCMAQIMNQLNDEDIGALASWLAAQPLPKDPRPAAPEDAGSALAAGLRQRVAMRRVLAWTIAALALLVVALLGAVHRLNRLDESTPGSASFAATPELVARGAVLARAGDCIACHTARGGGAYAGGRVIETPFGRVFSSNITPDAQTGIGQWSANDFWRAMHNGRSQDGHLLLPAFPYTSFTKVTRADTDAIYAYLRSVSPVRHANLAHQLSFPYNTQMAVAVWRALYFRPGIYRTQSSQSAEWNRGAYLVRGLGHCIECHSSRNELGATNGPLELSGGLIPMQRWYAPSLASPDEAGVAGWQTQQVVDLLRTGLSPRSAVIGPMAEVVFRSTQFSSDADLHAMAVFLQALPQASTATVPHDDTAHIEVARLALGHTVYTDRCAACHGDAGDGAAGAYPPLAGNREVTMASPANVIQAVLAGGFAPSTHGNPRPYGMPPFAQALNDAEVAAVATYVRRTWSNKASQVLPLDVLHAR